MKPDMVLMTPFLGLGRVEFTFPTTFFLEGTAAKEVGLEVASISGFANLCSLGSELGETPTVAGRANLTTIR